MFNTLYRKLVVVLIGFALIMAALFLAVSHYSFTGRSQEINQKLYRPYAARLVQENMLFENGRIDLAEARNAFERLRVINPRLDAYLLDREGGILVASSRVGPVRNRVGLEPVRQFLAGDMELPILGDDPAEASRQRVFSVARVALQDGADGYLYFVLRGFSGETLAQQIRNSYKLRESLMTIAGGLLLALVAAAIIVAFMTQRLRRLTLVMDKFRQSRFATPPDRAGARQAAHADEIDHLTVAFNEMAERMLRQMDALERTDSTRRELIANISHDLRTPLATLQGYLETLQFKGDRLSAEEKRNYLEIALKQSAHLSQLIAKLFELAKLDSGSMVLQPEPFVLSELVQDVVQQFELAASGKGIRVEARLPLEMALVHADIGLIERALRNLLENALRYTPAGGAITASVIPGEARATVEVADTGCGIEAADLPRIFDRFYRGEKSRSDSSDSAGLGLAITKRILDLHGSAISVSSKPGETVVSFTLPYVGSVHETPGTVPADADSVTAAPDSLESPLKARSAAG